MTAHECFTTSGNGQKTPNLKEKSESGVPARASCSHGHHLHRPPWWRQGGGWAGHTRRLENMVIYYLWQCLNIRSNKIIFFYLSEMFKDKDQIWLNASYHIYVKRMWTVVCSNIFNRPVRIVSELTTSNKQSQDHEHHCDCLLQRYKGTCSSLYSALADLFKDLKRVA